MDLRLSLQTNDLVFDGVDLFLTSTTDETLGQRIKVKLQTFLGEYVYNINAGIPWFQQILGKNGSKSNADSIIRTKVLQTPGVAGIESFRSNLDAATRRYTIQELIVKDANGGAIEVTI